MRIVYADGPGAPTLSPAAAMGCAGLCGPADVTLGWTIETPTWLDDADLSIATVMSGYGLARAVNDGRVVPLGVRLSTMALRLESDPPDLAVVAGVHRGSELALAWSVGWADVLARNAGAVVVEVDETGDELADLGGPVIDGNVVGTTSRPRCVIDPVTSRAADDIDLRVAQQVTSLIPDRATVQLGPGAIGEAIAHSIERPVGIWSGLVTDAMAGVHDRGLLAEPAVASYAWGGDPIRRLAAAGKLRLTSATIVNDISHLSSIARFVGCNTALQVGLDGSVNIERVGTRAIAGIGGHADFCAGASRSPGGLSIIAVRSTTGRGASTIVPTVDVVSTPRCDIDVVVTEHGIAHLRGASDAARARRLIDIAAPEHRSLLAASAA